MVIHKRSLHLFIPASAAERLLEIFRCRKSRGAAMSPPPPTLLLLLTSLILGGAVTAPKSTFASGMVPKTVTSAIADKHNAKCLQGTLPTFAIRRNSSSDKWVLFLEGGGWCYGASARDTIANCAARAGFSPDARGDPRGDPISVYGGTLAADPAVNPGFHTWNAVFLHYCDGSSFGSNRNSPIPVHSKNGTSVLMWNIGPNVDARTVQFRRAGGRATDSPRHGGGD